MRLLVTGGSGFIGMNLVAKLISDNKTDLVNLDLLPPKVKAQEKYWKQCDILNPALVDEIVRTFRPEAVVHLAARTDTNPENSLIDYEVNTTGTMNLLNSINACSEVKRTIFTSTQFVNQYNGLPKDDLDFAPHTVYGESKVIMEKMIRAAGLRCTWTIIRPTNIWGPWHIRYPCEFWKVLSKGMYFHPGKKPVVRSYGYVGNVVSQMISILESPEQKVNGKVYYVGDRPMDIYKWVNIFSLKQIGRNVTVVPRLALKFLALCGDFLAILKIRFPLTSSRYKSMTTGNTAPMEKTFEDLGEPPYSLEEGIDETIEWMKKYHPELIRYPG